MLEAPTQNRPRSIIEDFGEPEFAVELQHVGVGSIDYAVNTTRSICSKRCKQNAHQPLAN